MRMSENHITVTALPCGLAAIAGSPSRVRATTWRSGTGDLAGAGALAAGTR